MSEGADKGSDGVDTCPSFVRADSRDVSDGNETGCAGCSSGRSAAPKPAWTGKRLCRAALLDAMSQRRRAPGYVKEIARRREASHLSSGNGDTDKERGVVLVWNCLSLALEMALSGPEKFTMCTSAS